MEDPQVDLNFNPRLFTLLLPVTLEQIELPEDVKSAKQFGGKRFEPKEEYHITIISKSLGKRLQILSAEDHSLLYHLFELVNNSNWTIGKGTKFFHVVKDSQEIPLGEEDEDYPETIIVGVPLPGIAEFFKQFCVLTGETIEAPYYTHVTLLTYNNEFGIGVSTKQEYEDRVKKEIFFDELSDC